MLRMRRYRVFLLFAILAAASLYYLVNIQHASLSGLDTFRQLRFGQSTPKDQPTHDQSTPPPSEHKADAPPKLVNRPPPDLDAGIPPAPTDSAKKEAGPTLDDFKGQTNTKTGIKAAETVGGEELLNKNSKADDKPKLVSGSDRDDARVVEDIPRSRWRPQKEHNPIPKDMLLRLPQGKPKPMPKIQYDFPLETTTEKADRLRKLVAIRGAFKHAWKGYVDYAMMHDELLPVKKTYSDSFMGWGATLVDSLDALWILDLKDEFEEAVNQTKYIDFKSSYKKEIPMFETVIRLLGGLISAYDLSEERYPILLKKAVELAEILMGAFDTPNRVPDMYYKWAPSYASQQHRSGTKVVLAELGSLSMEFTRLAQLTKNHKYYDAVARVQNALEEWQMDTEMPGLWPLRLDGSGCEKPTNLKGQNRNNGNSEKPVLLGSEHVSEDELFNEDNPATLDKRPIPDRQENERRQADDISRPTSDDADEEDAQSKPADSKPAKQRVTAGADGNTKCTTQGLRYEPYAKTHTYGIAAQADSVYEYMPKMHRLLGGLSTQYESMYKNAAHQMRQKILFRPMLEDSDRKVLFPAVYEFDTVTKVASDRVKITWEGTHLGCFAGGMFGLAAKTFNIPSDMEVARQLTEGCIWAYESTPTKIMPEKFALTPCDDSNSCPWTTKNWHKALDPDLEERMAAVKAWNEAQRKLFQQTGIRVAKDNKQDGKTSGPEPTTSTRKTTKSGEESDRKVIAKRDPPIENLPTKASSHKYEPGTSELDHLAFVPKIAMSHETFVKGRIQEERLPTGYTKIDDPSYILRPEAIESIFIMWRLTGEEHWRQKGWNMFQAIQEATYTTVGNAGLEDVTSILGEKRDKMESFWLAETLKYFYLLFSEPTVISLDDYVLNTEAHPFRVPK